MGDMDTPTSSAVDRICSVLYDIGTTSPSLNSVNAAAEYKKENMDGKSHRYKEPLIILIASIQKKALWFLHADCARVS